MAENYTTAENYLTIVPDKYSKAYAQLFMQYISKIKGDKVECGVWSEKEFRHSQAKIPSSQPIVFIGVGDEAESNFVQMRLLDENYGMQIFSNGNRVILTVKSEKLDDVNYRKFKEFAEKHDVIVEDPQIVRKRNLASKRMWTSAKNSLPSNISTKLISSGIIKDQRYQCLIKWYIDQYIDLLFD